MQKNLTDAVRGREVEAGDLSVSPKLTCRLRG